MRWSTTLGGWRRRIEVLAAFSAAAIALFTLADWLKWPWLRNVGSVVIGIAGVALAIAKIRLEGRGERAESDRRFRVPIVPVTGIDPTQIGVDPATSTALGQGVPDYVDRDVDPDLRAAVEAALAGGGDWLLVVVGPSKVGKSRTLFQALATCSKAEQLQLLAPVNGDAVHSLLNPAQPLANQPQYAVLWLDDLEPFLTQGVSLQTLREWHATRPGWIVAATYGGKGSERVTATGELHTLADDVLRHSKQISLIATTELEIAPLSGRLSEADLSSVRDHGLAAYLVAGPALERKLITTRHAAAEPECPEGAALVRAAVDWARCGRTDPISRSALQELWPGFLPPGLIPTTERFDAALQWALQPVAARIALLFEHRHGYQAYDYVTRLVGEQPDGAAPRDAVWAVATNSATPEQAFAVAVSAFIHGRLEEAVAALRRASDSAIPVVAANALFNRGVTLGDLRRPQEALETYQQLIDTYGDDPTPELRVLTANALNNRGVTLADLSRPQEALETYQQLIDTYGDDPTPELREQTAKALFNRGGTLAKELGRIQEALDTYEQLIDTYGDDLTTAGRRLVANALNNRGIMLSELGRIQEALDTFEQVIDTYSDDPTPELRLLTARALLNHNRGVTLGREPGVGEAQ